MLGDGKSVVLSFDDGPAPVSALESILETLRLNEIKAEFYLLGSEVEQHPDAARMIVREGHGIQNHSWSHPDLSRATAQNVRLELKDTQAVIEAGIPPSKIKMHQATKAFGDGYSHGFLTVDMPDGKTYLVDTSFRQFFNPKAMKPDEPGYAGSVMRQTQRGSEIADQILSKGYVELTDEVAREYSRALTAGKSVKDATSLSRSTSEVDWTRDQVRLP
jgi:hypothetical protein